MVEHGTSHAPSVLDLKWAVANFAIYVAVLGRFVVPAVREYFRARTDRLREGLEAGATARRGAEALRAQLERDLAHLPALRDRLKGDLRAAAEQERSNLVAAGRQAADRIRRDAALLAEHEVTVAGRMLRAELAAGTVREAGALVRAALTADDQRRFLSEFVSGVGAST